MASFEMHNSIPNSTSNHNNISHTVAVTDRGDINKNEDDLENSRKEEIDALIRELQCLNGNVSKRREKLSLTIEDIINYCFNNAKEDYLLCPSNDDPFRKKKSCSLI